MPDYRVIENPNKEIGKDRKQSSSLDLSSALKTIEQSNAVHVLLVEVDFWKEGIPSLPEEYHLYDLLHLGLSLGGADSFKNIWFTSMNWLFLNPRSDRFSTSWKATPHWCLLQPQQVRDLGGFDDTYNTAKASLMDFAYRLLTSGGRVSHYPVAATNEVVLKIPFSDEINFIYRRINNKSALYSAFWAGLKSLKIGRSIKAYVKARKKAEKSSPALNYSSIEIDSRLINTEALQKVTSYSAVIPTIGRYEYVQKSIESLLSQHPAPDEIIVVDQTPVSDRNVNVYKKYDPEKVHVIFLDVAGQSISRNTAIEKIKSDWILLFEDDAVAWEDMMKSHIKVVEHSLASASTGVSLAPWKDTSYIPEKRRHFQISDVFSTGICLIKKDALESVNKLDLAYNHGSGADHDLGLRLFLDGHEIIYNPKAIHTHYKAPIGGLRTYGVHWRYTINWMSPYPQPTLIYTTQRFFPKKFWLPQYLLRYLSANKKKFSFKLLWLWFSMPLRLMMSLRKANKLHHLRSV